jgi:capsular polysaccharide biosynthesis protein
MLGEYIATGNGLHLVSRTGNCFLMNFPFDNLTVSHIPYDDVNHPGFWNYRQNVLEYWDSIPVHENASIWSHIYASNYYHFTFEFIQKARILADFNLDLIMIPHMIIKNKFQRDLLSRVIGGSSVIPIDGPIRVRDPAIADGWQSYESLLWLRKVMNISSNPGRNRYYIRRGDSRRLGSNIADTAEFNNFIKRHNFIAVDFGAGEVPINEQIDMLRDAAVILSPHGAGLTNLAYLNPPLTVIECFSRRVISASFLQISLNLGFKYFGIISEQEDSDSCMIMQPEILENVMDQIA